jgi:hypothetical protein
MKQAGNISLNPLPGGSGFAAKIFLHEKVDRRRWITAVSVTAGVALLAA